MEKMLPARYGLNGPPTDGQIVSNRIFWVYMGRWVHGGSVNSAPPWLNIFSPLLLETEI